MRVVTSAPACVVIGNMSGDGDRHGSTIAGAPAIALGAQMKIDGRCHCGAIAYEAEIDPDHVVLCHCIDCQTMSGGPCRVNVPTRTETLQLYGHPKHYTKIAASGAEVVTTFCDTCGTPIYSHSARKPGLVNLRIGCVAQRAHLPPKKQSFCESALSWTTQIASISEIPRRTTR